MKCPKSPSIQAKSYECEKCEHIIGKVKTPLRKPDETRAEPQVAVDIHRGPVYNRLRLMVELVIGGLCAMVVFYNFASPPLSFRKSIIAKADLRNAITSQEAYFMDHGRFADSIDQLMGPSYGLFLGEGIKIKVMSADENGYEMVALHKRSTKAFFFRKIKKKTRYGKGDTIKEISRAEGLSMIGNRDH